MRARTTQVETGESEPVPGVPEQGPPDEELIEARLAVVDVAPAEAVLALQVDRGRHATGRHQVREPGRVPLERLDDDIAEPVPLGRPVGLAQLERRPLRDDA